MIEIRDLLDRFRDLLLGEEKKKEVIRDAISSVIKTEVNIKDVKIKNNVIYLDIKPIYKSEILLRQEQIFVKIKESFGEKSPTEIR